MSESIKVFELAKELNLKALELLDKVKPLDLKLKNHMADLSAEQVEQIKNFISPPKSTDAEPKKKMVVRKKVVPKEAEAVVQPSKSSVVIRRAGAPTAATGKPGLDGVDGYSQIAANPPETDVQSAPVADESLPTHQDPTSDTPVDVSAESSVAQSEAVVTESQTSAPAVESTQAQPAVLVVPVRRGPRYSIIRVVSPETPKLKKPLIVEEAPVGKVGKAGTSAPKTFTDPELSRSATALIRENEEEFKRKQSATTRTRGTGTGTEADFKSTDFLRRERVYQPKKKRLSIGRPQNKTQVTQAAAHKRVAEVDNQISVGDLAHQMSIKVHQVAQKLESLGVERPDESMNFDDWFLDLDTAQLVSTEFGFEVKSVAFDEAAIIDAAQEDEDDANLKARSAVVTIMGHVDHGKTSLLDIIRRARVAAGEAGGITQHIGAYTVNVSEASANLQNLMAEGGDKKEKKKDKKAKDAKKPAAALKGGAAGQLTFLDTPGHAAFTSMRSRGAKVTDIVVLVVSAVDGVMPQTKEAIEHAKAAEVPLIVAVNKIDLPEANVDRIKKQLGDLGITPEDWGGDTIFVNVSAKTGEGVDKLLEMIQLQAEVLELKARIDGAAEGTVIEARLDKGRGPLASALISSGLIEVGQYVVAGDQFGKVRALIDDKGKNIKSAGPSTPVEILGLGGVPDAGDSVNIVADEKAARALAEHRAQMRREESLGNKTLTLHDLYARMNEGALKELPIILKADVKGSAEAIQAALMKAPQDKVKLKFLSVGVGGVTESDVLLASASKAIIIGFSVRADNKGQAEAERLGVEIKTYDIIYNLIDEVTKAMEGLLAPTSKETVMGRAEVRDVFTLSKSGTVAGCSVIKGKIQRTNQVRLIRDNRVIYTGKLSGLRRFKDDAREVAEGYECGISIENYTDIKKGDIIEAYMVESVAGRLTETSAST